MEKRRTIEEYDILRVLVTILVIIGHSGYYIISTNYGGCDYSEYAAQLGIVYKLFQNGLVELIYSFHMPLFMALSGALFHRSYVKNRYETLTSLVLNKAKRLMIPYFVVMIFYAFPLKLLTGYFENGKPLVINFLYGQVLLEGNNYLWYLLTLFCIFILFYIALCKKIPKVVILLICFCLNILSYFIEGQLMQCIFSKIIWFAVGYYFDESREKINPRLNKLICLLFGVGFFVLFRLNVIFDLSRFEILNYK